MTDPSKMPRRQTPPEPRPFTLSSHALQRAKDMGLTPEEVLGLVNEPHVTSQHDPSSKYYGGGTILHMRGEFSAVWDPETRTVVTFLYRWREGWSDNRELLGDSREARSYTHLPSREAPPTPAPKPRRKKKKKP